MQIKEQSWSSFQKLVLEKLKLNQSNSKMKAQSLRLPNFNLLPMIVSNFWPVTQPL
jgi:hypothetical protein